jgi:pimeloyl-ACP methyl ester carboxylesterase
VSIKTVNGVDLFYEELGSGPPLILHHGYTGAHDVWLDQIAPRLADRYRCIVMDARGAGDSAHPEGGYTIEQYALDVVGMADALGLDRFTYVGHSMGGGIGMQLGIEHADRLDKLVLVAPIPSGGTQADPEAHAKAVEVRQATDAREQMLRQRLLLRVRDVPDERVAQAVDRALSVSEAHFEDSWTTMAEFNVTDRLDELTTPTLIVAGAADGLCAANIQDFLRLPNASLHVFSRVGHGVPGDVPEQFSEVLADFFEHGVINARTQQEKLQAAQTEAVASR